VPSYGFGIMRLNHQYILSIVCLLLSSKINLRLSVCLIVLMIMIFCVLLGVPIFIFCVHIMLISWIFVHRHLFLGYSSFHLGYRYLDLASQRIYVSCHVYFHEDVFPFTKFEQIT
jgi:hypothetical protein